MQLFIVGNGFDRGHGLPTTYWNFRTYLENMYPEFLSSFEDHYDIYPRMDEKAKREILWNELETNLANIDEDTIIDQAASIEMDLESGDVGIEDTLYYFFSNEYNYIRLLAKLLNRWVRTIRIRDVQSKTTEINNRNDALYITFNYTAVLQTVYKLDAGRIIHIHGSLRQRDGLPVLGHGNKTRIENIQKKRLEAESLFDEKETSICRVVEDYYERTYKDISRYTPKLFLLAVKNITEISVVGHSLAGVDIPYFKLIDEITKQKAKWKVYYHQNREKIQMLNRLIDCGIGANRIEILSSTDFYDL
ncbi:bacteriophage abortive infection AbiH family protein [Desulfosporosinus sp. SB140]|uniref:bacteriophage abortive infection AbiH family protein n=1 Tax=Desulfosporosinus paludis TaxID=3115649 RepID=UPI00388D39AC